MWLYSHCNDSPKLLVIIHQSLWETISLAKNAAWEESQAICIHACIITVGGRDD